MNFDFSLPTRIIFGRGRISELGSHCRSYGNKALIISGCTSARNAGTLNKLTKSLEAQAIDFILSDNISPDPASDEIDIAIDMGRKHHSDFVIGVGGGSALDAAKAVAVGVNDEYDTIRNLIGKTLPPSNKSLPIIAVPTTAGTGSEVSKGAIIIDTVRQFKSGIRGDDLFPKVAIIDPELTSSMPIKVARETGFDALTHAIETCVARRSSSVSEPFSNRALHILSRNLPLLISEKRTALMEDELCVAALLGGINVANCGTCIPHRLQQAIGSLPHVHASHGQGLAILYPSWLSLAYPFAQDKFNHIAEIFHGSNIISIIDELCSDLKIKARLRDFGVTQNDIPEILKNVSGAVENDPIDDINTKMLRSILESSF